jgi:Cu+-exporting ATPase
VAAGWSRRRQRRLLGLLAFGDTVKPPRPRGGARLRALGIRTVMLTGDNRGSAEAVARNSASTRCAPRCCPATRRPSCKELRRRRSGRDGRRRHQRRAGAGAPTSGIAMAGGTDVATEAAGITLMRGDPAPGGRRASTCRAAPTRRSGRACSGPSATTCWASRWRRFGLLNPVIAGAAMAFSSVSVVAMRCCWPIIRAARSLSGSGQPHSGPERAHCPAEA